jgi:hypothetical protein
VRHEPTVRIARDLALDLLILLGHERDKCQERVASLPAGHLYVYASFVSRLDAQIATLEEAVDYRLNCMRTVPRHRALTPRLRDAHGFTAAGHEPEPRPQSISV